VLSRVLLAATGQWHGEPRSIQREDRCRPRPPRSSGPRVVSPCRWRSVMRVRSRLPRRLRKQNQKEREHAGSPEARTEPRGFEQIRMLERAGVTSDLCASVSSLTRCRPPGSASRSCRARTIHGDASSLCVKDSRRYSSTPWPASRRHLGCCFKAAWQATSQGHKARYAGISKKHGSSGIYIRRPGACAGRSTHYGRRDARQDVLLDDSWRHTHLSNSIAQCLAAAPPWT